MTAVPIFITGAQRSGTTLLEKLLGAQETGSLLSQPFPLLFIEAKRSFLAGLGFSEEPYPLGDLFLEERYEPGAFPSFLRKWRTTPAALGSLFVRMENYSGQYTRFAPDRLAEAFAVLHPHGDFADTISSLARSLASRHGGEWFGSKETTCEEYVPALLERGFRCAIIVRDPRDMIASLNHGRGREFGGEVKPTLFNIRNWRKSVATALAMDGHPRFHLVRYEDLTADPTREMDRLARNLDLPSLAGIVAATEFRDARGEPWRGNSSYHEHHGVTTASVGSYRAVLPPAVARFIEAACLPELQLLGYPTTMTRSAAIDTVNAFREPYTMVRPHLERTAANPANALLEIERLRRASAATDDTSARWFLFPAAHTRLREAFSP